MRLLDPGAAPVRFDGVVAVVQRADGWQPLRSDPGELHLQDPVLALMAGTPGGARLRLGTDSDRLELAVSQTRYARFGWEPARYDLVVDGELVDSVELVDAATIDEAGRHVGGSPSGHVRFGGLGRRSKQVEVWLPQIVEVAVGHVGIDDTARAWPVDDDRPRWLTHGSSITHGPQAAGPARTWPALVARAVGVRSLSLGYAGSCLVDSLTARVIRDQAADAISLKLGINVCEQAAMNSRSFRQAVHGTLELIREGHPTAPIALVSPLWSPATEDQPRGCSDLSLRDVREVLAAIVAQRCRHGDADVAYVDGLDLLGPADAACLPDGVHPDAEGHRRIAERAAVALFGDGAPFEALRSSAPITASSAPPTTSSSPPTTASSPPTTQRGAP